MAHLAKAVALSASLTALAIGSVEAGGFARGTADTDILYEPENFNLRAGATIVVPNQKFSKNVNPALVGVNFYETYLVPYFAAKFNISENFRCAGTYTQNVGADTRYDSPKVPSGKVAESFHTDEFGLTCAVRFQVGPGVLSVLGGAFVEELTYDRSTDLATITGGLVPGSAPLELSGQEFGWRAGVGYEIPEYALRAQLMYRSGTEYGAEGTLIVPGALIGTADPSVILPATGYGKLPQTLELKAQTGVAPGWLVYGSVKWTDWSVLQNLTVVSSLSTQVDQYQWRDGWTFTGGVGHQFNEWLSGTASLTSDRGVSTGWDLKGDVWTLALGALLKDRLGGELRGGVGFSYLASVEETNYADAITTGSDSGYNQATDAGYAISFNVGYLIRW